jgi:hypothetical protein
VLATCGLPAIMFLVARVNWSKLKVTPVRNYATQTRAGLEVRLHAPAAFPSTTASCCLTKNS